MAGGRGRRLVPAGYARCLANRDFRRMQPGFAISFLGDGMGLLAVAWLALQLAGPDDRPIVVGLAVAAYSLPGAIGSFTLGRWVSTWSTRRLIFMDSLLRGAAFTVIPALHWLGLLNAVAFIALLAVSSLLHSWGIAGRQTFVAETLSYGDRLAGHSLIGAQETFSYIAGPPLAGLVAAAFGPAAVLAVDAGTFMYLAFLASRVSGDGKVGARPPVSWRRSIQTLVRHSALLGLLGLTFFFYLLYGPIEVAVPVFVADRLGGAAVLGWIWGAFGIGAVLGSLITGTLRKLPFWPTTLAIVAAWGLVVLPPAQFGILAVWVAGFGLGGLIYAPYSPLSITLLQQKAPFEELVTISAFRSAVLLMASPLGAALGGLLVAGLGPANTIRLSGLTTIGLAIIGSVVVLLVRLRRGPAPPSPPPASPPVAERPLATSDKER